MSTHPVFPTLWLFFCFALLSVAGGCGTAKMSNTSRTATEQLLISDAMDRAVNQIDFSAVAGKDVFLDTTPIAGLTDAKYFTSLLRQHALASGCRVKDDKTKAKIIIEVRAGSVGTDNHDTMFGISEMTIPSIMGMTATTVPEVAVAKKTMQKAVIKVGVFAYSVETNQPIWQSGNLVAESQAKNRWLFGLGPYQTGSIYEKARFVGDTVEIPVINNSEGAENVSITTPVFFESGNTEKKAEEKPADKPAKVAAKK